jgi:SAM-dependent methyltransferase
MTANGSADAAFKYVGAELDLFARATNWKRYWAGQVRPYVCGRVLEIGAGIGANTVELARPGDDWTCLEPDAGLLERLERRLAAAGLPFRAMRGTTADMPDGDRFDCAIYIDVVEHIEDDRAELARAAGLLGPGGRLIVLAPAHQFLFSPFDASIGHFRRYSRRTLLAAAPPELAVERAFYLDAVGALASAVNRLALRQSMPTPGQISFWDGVLVRASRVLDPVLGYQVGKSVVAVWKK